MSSRKVASDEPYPTLWLSSHSTAFSWLQKRHLKVVATSGFFFFSFF
jgi:hypothetical protein